GNSLEGLTVRDVNESRDCGQTAFYSYACSFGFGRGFRGDGPGLVVDANPERDCEAQARIARIVLGEASQLVFRRLRQERRCMEENEQCSERGSHRAPLPWWLQWSASVTADVHQEQASPKAWSIMPFSNRPRSNMAASRRASLERSGSQLHVTMAVRRMGGELRHARRVTYRPWSSGRR